jgi:hypothetical protein
VRSTESLHGNHGSSGGPLLENVYKDDYNTMNLEIREDAEGNVFVKDLSLIPVTDVNEVMAVVNNGLKLRATHETKMNQVGTALLATPSAGFHQVHLKKRPSVHAVPFSSNPQVSSRSHTVFTVTVMQKDRDTGDAVSGTLHLVDLAGSERLKKSDSQGLRLREVSGL